MAGGGKVVVALDDSPPSSHALDWALQHRLIHPTDDLHIISVLPPAPFTAFPMVGGFSGGATSAAVAHESQVQLRAAKEQAEQLLSNASEKACLLANVPVAKVHTHALPAAGGASGVAESIVEYVKALQQQATAASSGVDLLVLGSRGMGAFARSLMGLVGLGSVSDYAAHNAHCPVLIARGNGAVAGGSGAVEGDAAAASTSHAQLHVMVACDGSPPADAALRWTLRRLAPMVPPAGAHDDVHDTSGAGIDTASAVEAEHGSTGAAVGGGSSGVDIRMHLVAVSQPVPLQVLDEPAAVAAMEAARYRKDMEDNTAEAQLIVDKYRQAVLQHGVPLEAVSVAVLQPEGSSDVGAALCRHAKEHNINLLVLGSRGMGAFARSLMGLVGLGSVSDYAAHNAHCPVVIVKQTDDAPLQEGKVSVEP